MLDQLTSADFTPHLHSSFRIHFDNGRILETTLVEVGEFAQHAEQTRCPFSLVFLSSERSFYLRQAIYTIEHEQMGKLDLFVVPLGPDASGMRYEVVFS